MKSKRVANDRGLILPLALMALVVLGALAAAILSIGGSEAQIASNHLRAVQAGFLAEAGLEHAFNTLRTTPNLVVNAPVNRQAIPGIADNTALGGAGSYTLLYERAGTNTVRVVSTGTSAIGGSRAIRRAVMSTYFHSNDAILTNGPLNISGNPEVLSTGGQCGNVHTNNNLTMSGNPQISGAVTASGTKTVSGNPNVSGGILDHQPTQTVPVIDPTDFLNAAIATLPANQIFQMKANGDVLRGDGTLIQHLNSGESYCYWTYTSGTPASWALSGNNQCNGTFYFEGNATLSGNHGSQLTPWVTTLIATGTMNISGNPEIQNSLTDTLFVADGNIILSGNPGLGFNGLIATHGVFGFSGNPHINGLLIAESTAAVNVSGNVHVTNNCGLNPPLQGPLQILSWGL